MIQMPRLFARLPRSRLRPDLTDSSSEKLPVDSYGELLSVVDNFLAGASGRSLIDAGEVQDFCLDIRQIITSLVDIENVI